MKKLIFISFFGLTCCTSMPVKSDNTSKEKHKFQVKVSSDVDKEGHNTNCRIISSDDAAFNQEALKYCRNVQSHPAMRNGQAVEEHDRHYRIVFTQID